MDEEVVPVYLLDRNKSNSVTIIDDMAEFLEFMNQQDRDLDSSLNMSLGVSDPILTSSSSHPTTTSFEPHYVYTLRHRLDDTSSQYVQPYDPAWFPQYVEEMDASTPYEHTYICFTPPTQHFDNLEEDLDITNFGLPFISYFVGLKTSGLCQSPLKCNFTCIACLN
ncbi:unnamed protein product [Didymodactylos carnosus]|uniref:Uncharacterized protein n=1 Tax=Didymodactylos carnosus TaxID=1234261 RepID=A0A815V5V2_9BILA|nr:unnamed protein product [Didymodactylos carnosus]CAF1526275.1 unnamed protein product [Didymodactylos carnosus]CAF3512103.1 unnamed protein product [Didymodactylos carnosus]CAF4385343.1 unnamed protein product [Didymodactylos carnosus]